MLKTLITSLNEGNKLVIKIYWIFRVYTAATTINPPAVFWKGLKLFANASLHSDSSKYAIIIFPKFDQIFFASGIGLDQVAFASGTKTQKVS